MAPSSDFHQPCCESSPLSRYKDVVSSALHLAAESDLIELFLIGRLIRGWIHAFRAALRWASSAPFRVWEGVFRAFRAPSPFRAEP